MKAKRSSWLIFVLLASVVFIIGCSDNDNLNSPACMILSFSPEALDFGTETETLQLEIANTAPGTMDWNMDFDGDWLSADPTSGSLKNESETVTLTVDRTGLSAGAYESNIKITSDGGIDSLTVTLEVTD